MNKVFLRMGNLAIATEPSEITTVLGSCVAVCIWDYRKGTGGMIHFKAPRVPANREPSNMYGEVAIRNLIQSLLRKGSRKPDLRAMLFGGGSVIDLAKGQPNVGRENIRFAQEELEREGFAPSISHVGGHSGRKITFNTMDGSITVSRVKPLGAFIRGKA